MNKKTLILIFLSIPLAHTNAMELLLPVKRKRATSQPNLISHVPQKNKTGYIEPSLPAILKQKIFTISSLCSTCTSLKDAGITVNALVRVDKFLNGFINDDERTLQLIKQLSDEFNETNIEVTKMLWTKAANNRFALQLAFFVGWDGYNFNDIKCHMNRLKRIGFDLDFTYNDQRPTVLIQAMSKSADKVVGWLIENGADINVLTPGEQNAGMLALMKRNQELIHTFLDHPDFKVNHQDSEKYTPLHCCFYNRCIHMGTREIDKTKGTEIYEIVKKLLEKGANPIAMSDDGKTPLALAQESDYQPLIDLLEKAAVVFESIKK